MYSPERSEHSSCCHRGRASSAAPHPKRNPPARYRSTPGVAEPIQSGTTGLRVSGSPTLSVTRPVGLTTFEKANGLEQVGRVPTLLQFLPPTGVCLVGLDIDVISRGKPRRGARGLDWNVEKTKPGWFVFRGGGQVTFCSSYAYSACASSGRGIFPGETRLKRGRARTIDCSIATLCFPPCQGKRLMKRRRFLETCSLQTTSLTG